MTNTGPGMRSAVTKARDAGRTWLSSAPTRSTGGSATSPAGWARPDPRRLQGCCGGPAEESAGHDGQVAKPSLPRSGEQPDRHAVRVLPRRWMLSRSATRSSSCSPEQERGGGRRTGARRYRDRSGVSDRGYAGRTSRWSRIRRRLAVRAGVPSRMRRTTPRRPAPVCSTPVQWSGSARSRDRTRKHSLKAPTVAFARTVTLNLVRAMASGPLGHGHPARGDLAAWARRRTTSTGTGGRVGSMPKRVCPGQGREAASRPCPGRLVVLRAAARARSGRVCGSVRAC